MELTAELAVSGENNVSVEWGETLRAVPTVIDCTTCSYHLPMVNDLAQSSAIFQSWSDQRNLQDSRNKIGYSIWCKVTATDD